MGHEVPCVVEGIGSQVTGPERGDFVIAPFAFTDNTCPYGVGGVGARRCGCMPAP
ncbi:hypothetical protein ACIGO6_24020 [Streptomyces sp. NPDC053750]|uniref:hypothetical protein n=1 Tax=Streptomyces sp. NPDC053750 TaxID=3365714 RepID=UPI0037CFB467